MRLNNFKLCILTFLFLMILSVSVSALNNSNLNLHLPFDGNAEDISGQNNSIVVYGAVLAEDRDGNFNSSYYFDGVDDYMDLGQSTFGMEETNEFTTSLWMKFEDGSSYNEVLIQRDDYVYPFRMQIGGSSLITKVRTDRALAVYSQINLKDDNWHHLVLTYKDGIIRNYIDGVEDNYLNLSGDLHADPDLTTNLGKMPGFDYYFNGFIDDVRIYNKGLSESEIEELYEGILIPINCTDNDLDGYSIEGGECGLVDCDDSNENINPGVEEICNGIDDNCVLGIDEGGNSLCSDNLFCNGAEVCMSSLGCLNGIPIDCSFNNLESFSVCDYSPDNNSFTLDFFAGFNSVCNEDTDSCTNSIIEVSHNCSLNCGAECEFDLDCDDENNLTLDICNGCFCEHSFLSICGNNLTDYNETCDGNLQSCLTSEGYFGYQKCNLECNGWQECIAIESCGDGIINGNEICDNNNLSEENCETQGFDEGSLGCLSDCSGYNISECVINQTPQGLIWDNFEESSARRNQIVTFYANYNDGENPIDGADCLITFEDGNWNMTDAGNYYEFYRTFPEEGLESWSVNCQATGYDSLEDFNNITITDYPSNVLVIDHRAIDEFDELLNDNETIESAKKLVGQSVGQSHSTQVIYGLKLLAQQDSRLSIDIYGDEPVENKLNGMSDYNGELRITNKQFNTDFSSAGSYIGEEDYWAFEDARLMTEFTTNNFNPKFNFSLWWWCSTDMLKPDNVFQEDGTKSALFSDINLQSYLNSLERFNTNYSSIEFIYSTSPMDAKGDFVITHKENGNVLGWNTMVWNEKIIQEAINEGGVLYDTSDIENWDSENNIQRIDIWENHLLYMRHHDYDYHDENDDWEQLFPETNPYEDHTNDELCIRKAKAFWVMVAKLTGWSANYSHNKTGCIEDSDCFNLECNSKSCVAGECIYTPLINGTLCLNNGLFCDGEEVCQSGECVSSGNPCVDDEYSCTNLCDENLDECNVANDSLCDDGNVCTFDYCIGKGGNLTTGCGYDFENNSVSCDDSYYCTENDMCDGLGNCQGTPNNEICLQDFFCCTSAVCNPLMYPITGCGNYFPLNCQEGNLSLNNSNLKLHLPFDGNAEDVSGENNLISVYGAVLAEDRDGNSNSSYYFDGVDDYMDLGQSTFGMEETNEFTTSLWMKFEDGSSYNEVLLQRDDYVYPFRMQIGGSSLITKVRTFDGALPVYSQINLKDDNWHYLVLTYKDGIIRNYIDGVEDNYLNLSGDLHADPDLTTNLGKMPGFDYYFNGFIDDVRIYNKGLSESEIEELYLE